MLIIFSSISQFLSVEVKSLNFFAFKIMSGLDVESQALRDPKKSLAFKAKKFYLSYKLQMLVAEAMGTGTLTFWGCMGCIDWYDMPG